MYLKNHSIIGHVFVECSFDPVSSYFLITYCLTDVTPTASLTPLTGIRLNPCATSPGHLAHPIPNTGYEVQHERFRAEIFFGESVRVRHVSFGTLPCVSITNLIKDVYMATNAISDMLRLMKRPARSQRKVVRKDQLHY